MQDTKVNLEKITQRLKEAKEETEQIRRNCQEIIKTYQVSQDSIKTCFFLNVVPLLYIIFRFFQVKFIDKAIVIDVKNE